MKYEFYLNDNLKKYIREAYESRDKLEITRDYMAELEHQCDITINCGDSYMTLRRFYIVPDWEAKCFRINRKFHRESYELLDRMMDLKNTFNIPFEYVRAGHVKFVESFWAKTDLTQKYIELIDVAFGELRGTKYEFIPEAWDEDCLYKINGTFYTVYLFKDQLHLRRCDNGQCVDVTPLELLRGKYDYISQLKKENGLLIPNLEIEKYTKVADDNE